MTKEIFAKFLQNQLDDAELKTFVQWVNSDAFAEECKELMYEDWEMWAEEPEYLGEDEKFDRIFDKIYEKTNYCEKADPPPPKTSRLQVYFRRAKAAAAVLFLPMLGFLIYLTSVQNPGTEAITATVVDALEVEASSGSRTVVQMTDGTKAYLNYGSKLRYPQVFAADSRVVELEGEGYFEVAHNPDRPFIVKAGQLNIKAVGTSFNVLAYPGEQQIQTTLVEGVVIIEETSEQNSDTVTLAVGDHVIYDRAGGEFTTRQDNLEKYIAWKDGKIVFDNETTTEVAARLSRAFNVEIEIAEAVKDLTYTVTFTDETLTQILDLMSLATPVRYEVLPREELEDGTFGKQKIKIDSKH
jgi:ferric-dicitrate binding protein FerR (iron transport regulator)